MTQTTDYASDTDAIRLRKRSALSEEERERIAEEETRRGFASTLARAKAILQRRENGGNYA